MDLGRNHHGNRFRPGMPHDARPRRRIQNRELQLQDFPLVVTGQRPQLKLPRLHDGHLPLGNVDGLGTAPAVLCRRHALGRTS